MSRILRLADRLIAPLHPSLDASICFLHLPKCGGTSLSRAIARRYPPPVGGSAPIFTLHHRASTQTAQSQGLPLDAVRDTLLIYALNDPRVRFVTGHFRITAPVLTRHADRYAFITLLRHPVARWTSHFFYDRYRPDRTHAPIDDDLPAFFDTPRARRLGTVFVRRLGGAAEAAYDAGYGTTLEADIERACANLDRLACVGVLEHMPEFLDAFAARFGKRLHLRHENPNPVAREDQRRSLTPDVQARIEDLCRPDLAVYRHALDRLGLPEPPRSPFASPRVPSDG